MLALTEYGLRLVVAESEIGRLPTLSGGESPPQPSPQEDLWEKIKEFLQKYGIYIAVGLVVLLLLGGRRR